MKNKEQVTFDQVTRLNTESGIMFRLYTVAFDRFPDAGGLEYWINQYTATSDANGVAKSFLASDEFQRLYGTDVSNEEYVEALYLNVLDRLPDQGGLDYWVGTLDDGRERDQLLLDFSESPENKELFSEMTGFF